MAFNRKNYPPYWKQFSEYIRFERAGNKCEKCGVINGWYKGWLDLDSVLGAMQMHPDKIPGEILIGYSIGFLLSDTPDFGDHLFFVKSVSKICLTVAHLDNWGDVCQCRRFFGFKCAKPSHVLALCQSCHLNYDRKLHLAVRRKNTAQRKDASRGLLTLV